MSITWFYTHKTESPILCIIKKYTLDLFATFAQTANFLRC